MSDYERPYPPPQENPRNKRPEGFDFLQSNPFEIQIPYEQHRDRTYRQRMKRSL